jgi:rhodanese-related sulfurtransferase
MREIDVFGLASQFAQQGLVLIDVRQPDEYLELHVPGARLLPLAQLSSHLDQLPEDQRVYLICATGRRSRRAAEWLAEQGRDAVSVAGGTVAWVRAGLPVHRGNGCCGPNLHPREPINPVKL